MKESLVQAVLWLLARQGNPSLLPWAFDRIGELFRNDPEGYFRFLRDLRNANGWVYRFFVGHQAGSLYSHRPEDVPSLLRDLSGDDNDLVLEAAAHGWSEALRQNFGDVFPMIEELADQGDYAERRTAALAPVEYYRDEDPTPAERERIEAFWEASQDDPRQGLRNLVRSQIQERYVHDDDS